MLLLGTSFSCTTYKEIKKLGIKPMKKKKLHDSIRNNQIAYKTLQLKFSSDYEQDPGGAHSFSGTIRIQRDSIIWISLSAVMGIEAARIQLTPDSLFFVNRLNSTFYVGDYEHINNLFQIDMDFFTLQAIIYVRHTG